MTSPLTDMITTLSSASSRNPTPQQRLDSTLTQLSIMDSSSTQQGSTAESISKGELVEPLQRINAAMRPRGLEFEMSEQSSRIITRVIDRESGEIIRQIPAEEVVQIAKRLEEVQGSLISLEA
ncbi:flagellar protein FlaG [Vreelandella songnenensis]|uniref:Flagellar protein FlaG n=1 Tax=Vreelandella songnenensis TaxID=1176243 RepID=A0A2T0V387_9GAMM|nr:flagellar protein FlaG [Halomonas songnenensis]PRY64587.1 flagellar protein FlaG [Halomonas songnenensis]